MTWRQALDPRRPYDGAAVAAARLTGALSRITRRGSGSTVPGRVLRALDPGFVGRRAARLPRGVALVSGTNGKTTTASMLRSILRSSGAEVAGNEAGANLLAGIATALARAPRRAELAVLEVDEAALPRLVPILRPRVLILTNVVRDQLDRFAEPEQVARLLAGAADDLPPEATLVVNADDARLWSVLGRAGTVRVGLEPGVAIAGEDPATTTAEPVTCPACSEVLPGRAGAVAGIGRSDCGRCGWATPRPHVVVRVGHERGIDGIELWIGSRRVRLRVGGLHNAANAGLAVAGAAAFGLTVEEAARRLDGFRPRFGRGERARWRGRDLWLGLMKNPSGADALVRQVAGDPRVGAAVVAVNDRDADGRDVSWIWDAPLERLLRAGIPVIPAGTRADDVALRLKYAGGGEPRSEGSDPAAALERAIARCRRGRTVAVLATYTAMLDTRATVFHDRAGRTLDRVG